MSGRWLCNKCGRRFATPDYSIVEARLPLKVEDDDPSLPHGQVVKYHCPTCGSGDLVGAANSDPLTPIQARRK